MPPLSFGGHDFRVAGGKALFWPRRQALIVADLHLEKASWFAARGQMLPPHDTMATLEALAGLITQTHALEVWCLGDNFHDVDGPARLAPKAQAVLAQLTATTRWTWITGNHDEVLPKALGGEVRAEAEVAGLVLRHQADPDDPRPEISGHFHPKHRTAARGRSVSRPCFVEGPSKLLLPAFGALTGGMSATEEAIRLPLGRIIAIHVPAGDRLVRFAA